MLRNKNFNVLIEIIFSCIFLNINVIITDDDCQQWQQMCENARLMNNVNFRCINDTVYYIDYDSQSWENARQMCSQKFYGSYTADLVELSPKNLQHVNTTIKDILQKHYTDGHDLEFFANGVCCKRKKSNDYQRQCQWLSNEETIETPFTEPLTTQITRCNILLIKAYIVNNQLNYFARYVERDPNLLLPYLCAYKAPEKCQHVETISVETTTYINSGTTDTCGYLR